MHIEKLIVKNYRTLKSVELEFHEHINVIVGNNEVGKSTVLEAISLALTYQLNGRSIQAELHPHLFNSEAVKQYLQEVQDGKNPFPPAILIELYFNDDQELESLRGNNNSLGTDNRGVSLTIALDEDYKKEYAKYISSKDVKTIPVEFFEAKWLSFAGEEIKIRKLPIRSTLIDASANRQYQATNKYILDIADEYLRHDQKVALSLSYRRMKDLFLKEEAVDEINKELASKKGKASDRTISVALDTTSRSGWQNAVMAHLDDVPLPLIGKGEQNCVKIKLAIASSTEAKILLIEEPENHLSFSNLNKLIAHIRTESTGKQVFLTTHSSFVLNKLGVESVILFTGKKGITLEHLSPETRDYFLKLPGHDTLRMILAKRAILVEGPSDELVVQRLYKKMHARMPIEDGIDVISVKSLAFKRFLEIADLLDLDVRVATDNDGDLAALRRKYADYVGKAKIRICFDEDEAHPTLEPQLFKVNGRATLNRILGKTFATDQELKSFMEKNKTECALCIFGAMEEIAYPPYLEAAIAE